MKTSSFSLPFIIVIMTVGSLLYGHCEIPCGIYDDEARFNLLEEHVTTIEKSMQQITKMENEEQTVSNQYVRWIMNKEEHATDFQHIVTQYFMTQRIKPDTESYADKLVLLHKMLIASMKCKQTTDLRYVEELRDLIEKFHVLYSDHH